MVDGWVFSKEKTLKLINGSPFIIDFSQENYGDISIPFYYKLLKDLNIDFLLLSYDPNDHLVEPNILFYPNWYIWSIKNFEKNLLFLDNRKYKISCLNRNPRPHRILNFFLLKNKNYFNDILFTFQNVNEGADRSDDVILPLEIKEQWEQIRHTLPSYMSEEYINHSAWTDTYINFVTETTVNEGLFISEKTWKPIASEQLFLVYGNKGIINHLRDIGVDVFDDIIDHNYYDNVSDFQERLIRIHSLIESLINQNLNEIFIATKVRRKQNRTNFLQGVFGKQYLDLIELKCTEMQK
jgi:hypothetical protein